MKGRVCFISPCRTHLCDSACHSPCVSEAILAYCHCCDCTCSGGSVLKRCHQTDDRVLIVTLGFSSSKKKNGGSTSCLTWCAVDAITAWAGPISPLRPSAGQFLWSLAHDEVNSEDKLPRSCPCFVLSCALFCFPQDTILQSILFTRVLFLDNYYSRFFFASNDSQVVHEAFPNGDYYIMSHTS